jgi:hypothetical protein
MNLLLIALFSFLAAMSLIIVMFFVPMAVQNSPQARIKRRLTTIGRAGYASRADVQNLLKSSLYSDVPWVNALLSRVQMARHLDLLLERANVDMTLGLFILCSVVASGVAAGVAGLGPHVRAVADDGVVPVGLKLEQLQHTASFKARG